MRFPTVNASIITIGDELLIGQTIDTNSAFIAQELNKIGVWVRRRVAVGDVYAEIWNALQEEEKQSDIILLTGGLGPTADDITKPLLCDYFGGKMVLNQQVLDHVHYLFEKVFKRPGGLLERNRRQAEVPDVCAVLFNKRGTAPGMLFTRDPQPEKGKGMRLFFSLPGVPHEMKGLMTKEVIPRIRASFELPAIVHRTVFTAGQGESLLAETLKDFEPRLPSSVKLAYLPNYGMVKLRLTSLAPNRAEAENQVQPFYEELQELVKAFLVSNEDLPLEIITGRLLEQNGKTLGTAESCTGGYIAHLITSVPGSSAWYKGSVVSYANETKVQLLGVQEQTLQKEGAVSEATVREMAEGALKALHVDYALAVSGIMGPEGGSEEKPVGTVWAAVSDGHKTETWKWNLPFDRSRNISQTATMALNFLRQFMQAGG